MVSTHSKAVTAEFKKEGSIGYLIHEVSRLLKRRFEDEARSHGITLPQWRTLAEITHNAGISQVALATAIDTDPMTLSGILDRLEKRGLVERYPDPNDSRAKLARLTRSGRHLVDIARDVGRELYENALEGLGPEQRQQMTEGLRCIRDNLSRQNQAEKEAV
jgi:MarR family transcriptional regulator for hemolysin